MSCARLALISSFVFVAACGGDDADKPGTTGQGGSGPSSTSSGSSSSGTAGGSGPEEGPRCDAGPEANLDGWRLVWCDEFNGTAIDPKKWDFDIGDGGNLPAGPGWGNQEKEYYTKRSENAHTEGGNLVLSALKDGPHYGNGVGPGYDYSSARMVTRGNADWTYGRFEARAKLPSGQGLWPAIWMLPVDPAYGGWAASGEIDILELKGQAPNIAYGTLHFGNQWNRNEYVGCQYAAPGGDLSQDFHVFAVEWDSTAIKFFADGVQYETQLPRGAPPPASICTGADGSPQPANFNENVTDPKSGWHSSGGNPPAPFDQAFYFILNVAVGGQFVGDVDPAVFPQAMTVDYVRVYQR